MASKQVALGTILKVDEDDSGSVFTTITLAIDATPPARKRARIPTAGLSDTLETNSAGIELSSEFVYNQYWHPTDTQHAAMDTLFASKASVIWNLVTPHGTPITDSWEGWVSDLEPALLTVDGMFMRKCTIQRDTAITRT